MKISLILPVYNVELYVEQCLLSCINQNIPSTDYEIIVVNDGTKDNSLEIVNRIASQYDNIIVVSQENAGLSAARNKGLSLAKGDYVWFIDTDDYIKESCLKEITEKFENNNLDALSIAAVNFYGDGSIEARRVYKNDNIVYNGNDALALSYYYVCAPFTIYRREFLLKHNLKFMLGVFHEDNEFTLRAYYFLNRVSSYSPVLYFVRQNPTSITRSVNPKKSYDCIEVAKSLSYFNDSIVCDELKYVYYNQIGLLVNNSLYNILRSKHDNVALKEFGIFICANNSVFDSLTRSSIMKYKIEGLLFKIFPKYIINTYKILTNLKF